MTTFLISVILLVTLSFFNIYVTASEATEAVKFGYVGKIGPAFWHLLSEESKICQTGIRQSPIDITSEDLMHLATPPPAEFHDAKKVDCRNNGNTVEICSGDENIPLPATIEIAGEPYELKQFHFHTPSEHRINGVHHDIEQHLVFLSKDEKVSVVAVFYDIGEMDSKFMDPIIKNLPKKVDETKEIEKIELKNLLCDIKNITQAFTYSGSLTTPPCTEGVTWYVNKDALSISLNQFLELRSVTGFNSRFTQLKESDRFVDNNETLHTQVQPKEGEHYQTEVQPKEDEPYKTEPYQPEVQPKGYESYQTEVQTHYKKRSLYPHDFFRTSK